MKSKLKSNTKVIWFTTEWVLRLRRDCPSLIHVSPTFSPSTVFTPPSSTKGFKLYSQLFHRLRYRKCFTAFIYMYCIMQGISKRWWHWHLSNTGRTASAPIHHLCNEKISESEYLWWTKAVVTRNNLPHQPFICSQSKGQVFTKSERADHTQWEIELQAQQKPCYNFICFLLHS